MDTPEFTDGQFVNGSLLNTAFGSVMADFGIVGSDLHTSGLVSPSSLTITPSGLNVTVSAPSPFAVLFSSGFVVGAHGTTAGADTSSYTVNLASLVPGSGSVTAYIVARYTQIGENLVTVVGPPPGQPDYNPNFNPFEFYSTQRDSLTIVATTTAPDNATSFELCRIALTAGQNSITSGQIDKSHWHYASSILNPTGVTPGTYTGATVTVGADGRITSASSVAYGPIDGDNTWTAPNTFADTITAAGGVIADGFDSGGAQFRATNGNYGAMLRNDGGSAYLLSTASGNSNGGFNSLRPFTWNLATGAVTVDATGAGTDFGGAITVADPNNGGVIVNAETGSGANIKLTHGGNKFMRCVSNIFEIVNSAYTTAILSLDDAGNLSTAGTIAANGNITASNGRLRASDGAKNSGDNNAAVILSDFFYSSNEADSLVYTTPSGMQFSMFTVSAPAPGSGLWTTNFSIPNPFPAYCDGAIISFLGTTPPFGGSIAVSPVDRATVEVTTNSNANSLGPYGCVILVFGH